MGLFQSKEDKIKKEIEKRKEEEEKTWNTSAAKELGCTKEGALETHKTFDKGMVDVQYKLKGYVRDIEVIKELFPDLDANMKFTIFLYGHWVSKMYK